MIDEEKELDNIVKNISEDEIIEMIDESEEILEENINKTEKSMEDNVEEVESVLNDLSESENEQIKEITEDLKELNKIDIKLSEQFKELKDTILTGDDLRLDLITPNIIVFKDVHSKIYANEHIENYSQERKDLLKNVIDILYKPLEEDDKANVYIITIPESEEVKKYYVLKDDYMKIIHSFIGIDQVYRCHKVLDQDKIREDVYMHFGENDASKDFLEGLFYIGTELHYFDNLLYERDKIVYDSEPVYENIFGDVELYAEEIQKEYEEQIRIKVLEKEFPITYRSIINRIDSKIKEKIVSRKNKMSIVGTINYASLLLANIIRFKINTPEQLLEEEIVKEFSTDNDALTRAVKLTLCRRLRKHSMKTSELSNLIAFIYSVSYSGENNPWINLCIELAERINVVSE